MVETDALFNALKTDLVDEIGSEHRISENDDLDLEFQDHLEDDGFEFFVMEEDERGFLARPFMADG